MRDRSGARGWALQVLYAWEAREPGRDAASMLQSFVRERNIAPGRREYLGRLIQVVDAHRSDIDRRLEASLTNWRLDRLSAIDRNVLRIGAAEMLYMPDVPERVAIQEAIILAEKYGTAESPRFVNGVLDALMHRRREGPDEPGGAAL